MPKEEEILKRTRETQRTLFGERYVGSTISQIRAPEWAQILIQNFMKDPRHFLIYFGNPGIGKTHLCASLIEWSIRNFNTFRYWNETELLKRVRKSIDECSGDYVEALHYMIDDELVMIDDIGSTGTNDWRKEILFETIDKRYNSRLPTIITSNLSKQEFNKVFHDRLCSRLFASENTLIEIHDGFDFRQEEPVKRLNEKN